MRTLVPCAVAALCEHLTAVVAFEWFLSSMRPLVHCAVAALRERLVAVVAFEWLLSSMHPLVPCAVTALYERLVAMFSAQNKQVQRIQTYVLSLRSAT